MFVLNKINAIPVLKDIIGTCLSQVARNVVPSVLVVLIRIAVFNVRIIKIH